MELKFLGIGSAFQTKMYNTSGYFVEDDTLFLIDCGETTFEQLQAQDFFEDIREIYVAFTHTHSDHIAGIAKLINYCNDVLDTPLNIVVPTKSDLYKDIFTLLDIFSISDDKCCYIAPDYLANSFETFDTISFLPTKHSPELDGKCYSLLFETKSGKVLYSGDSIATEYIKSLVNSNFDKMYVDVTMSIPVAHLDLNVLSEIVPINLRQNVYCMHFDSEECLNRAKELGFNIAESVAVDLSNLPLSFSYAKLNKTDLCLNNCNELAFMQLQHNNLLNGVASIYLMIENTNANNVAGLGSLLTYSHFVLKKPIYICNKDIVYKMLKLARIYGVSETSLVFLDSNLTLPNDSQQEDIFKIFDIVIHKAGKTATKYVDASSYLNSSWIPLTSKGDYKVTTISGKIGYNFVSKSEKYVFVNIGDLILESFLNKEEISVYQIQQFDKISQKAICKLVACGNPKTDEKLSKFLKISEDLDNYLMFLDRVTGA